jgi:eukaryotic-like serine/threonine-protein kinase
MASVWVAEDLTLGRLVAIKLLSQQFLGDSEAVRRFEREARAAASLSSHPNVVTIFDVGEQEGRPFIVMEYMSGGSLADVKRGGRQPARQSVLRWLEEAASALDAAHERGIVHRDVKPANLLLDERDSLGVTDFGIARVAFDTTVTRTGQVLGTAAYLSPEQAAGEPASPASDRYALAVVAYELLTGGRPFGGEGFAIQASQHMEADPVPPSARTSRSLPRAVDRVLLRGLEKDPQARWPSAGAMVSALEEALDRSPEAAVPPTAVTEPLGHRARASGPPTRTAIRPPVRPRPPVAAPQRRPRRWVAPAVLTLAALALVAALASLGPGDGDQRPAEERPKTTAREPTTSAPRPDAGETSRQPAPQPAPTADGRNASQLNAEGHRLMNAGRYEEAIPPLKAAVARCGDSTVVDPCAYALYNLGRSLRLAGRPDEAIPILERRLRIPNQQDTVREELDAARRAAGRANGDAEG